MGFASKEKISDRSLHQGQLTRNKIEHRHPSKSNHIFQPSLGNSYLQSLTQTNLQSAGASIQRACACGNSCASCMPGQDTQRKLQTQLEIGAPNDEYEQEAERVAKQVIQMSQAVAESDRNHPTVDTIQHIATNSSSQTQETSAIDLESGEGQPLSPATRAFMEPRFGVGFEHVQLHIGERSQQQAAQIGARAFTYGNHIWLGRGESEQNNRLMAHELTHVVQQRAGSPLSTPTVQRQPAAPATATGGLTEEMLKQIARTLREAMKGWGTDEEAIYSAFSGRTQEQVDAIARVYQQMYRADLLEDLRDELTDSEMEHLAIFSPTAAPGKVGSAQQATGFADLIAHQLNKAMDRLGTDEDSIYSALTGRTPTELQAIKDAYKRLTNRELEADIRDEMSGSELTHALTLLNQGVLLPEDEAYLAMKGAGTDEETLARVLETVKGDRAKVIDLIDKFHDKGYGNLLEWVNEELSGSDLDKALEALHGQTPSGTCSRSQRQDGLEAISLAAAMAQSATTRANTDLVSNQLSGAVESALSQYFNPGNAPNAINLGLLRQVRDALERTHTDILSFSNVVCVTQNDGHCVIKPDCNNFVAAHTNIVGGATVNICPAFFSCSNDQATTMLHEFFHHMGIRDRGIYYGQAGYSSLTPIGDGSVNDSLSKADAYAHFAKELY